MAIPALSNTYTFNPSAYYLIARALRICQVIAEDEVPSNATAQDTLFALNSMVKAWQGSGIHVWAENDATLFLQPNQTSYQLGIGTPDHWTLSANWLQLELAINANAGDTVIDGVALPTASVVGWQIGLQMNAGNIFWSVISAEDTVNKTVTLAALPGTATAGALAFIYLASPVIPRPLRIPAARRYLYSGAAGGGVASQPNEIPLVPMSRLDYAAQPNKSNTGAVTQFFYDPQVDPVGVFYCWPTPQDDQSAVKFTQQRPLQDINNLTQLVDVPKEWLNCIAWNLAKEIGPEFDVAADRWAMIKERAESLFTVASAWDRETGSVLFGVANDPSYRAG